MAWPSSYSGIPAVYWTPLRRIMVSGVEAIDIRADYTVIDTVLSSNAAPYFLAFPNTRPTTSRLLLLFHGTNVRYDVWLDHPEPAAVVREALERGYVVAALQSDGVDWDVRPLPAPNVDLANVEQLLKDLIASYPSFSWTTPVGAIGGSNGGNMVALGAQMLPSLKAAVVMITKGRSFHGRYDDAYRVGHSHAVQHDPFDVTQTFSVPTDPAELAPTAPLWLVTASASTVLGTVVDSDVVIPHLRYVLGENDTNAPGGYTSTEPLAYQPETLDHVLHLFTNILAEQSVTVGSSPNVRLLTFGRRPVDPPCLMTILGMQDVTAAAIYDELKADGWLDANDFLVRTPRAVPGSAVWDQMDLEYGTLYLTDIADLLANIGAPAELWEVPEDPLTSTLAMAGPLKTLLMEHYGDHAITSRLNTEIFEFLDRRVV